jgi:Excisionase-like protein
METNANPQTGAGDSFCLESLPANLWGMARMVVKLRADDQTIRRWIREGRIPGPTLRRGRRAYWNPSEVEPYRRRRLRRIGAEIVEAVGVATPTASGFSLSGDQQGKANENGA